MLTPTQQAYKTIKQTLNRERVMRERVFKETKKREEKCQEIDDALAALELLAQAIKLQQQESQTVTAQQAVMF
jgi:hypothetical protein